MENGELKDKFDFDEPKSIIQSSLHVTEKKIQLRVLRGDIEDKIKAIKKVHDRQPTFMPNPIHLLLLFLVFYLPTKSLSFALSIFIMIMIYHYFRFFFQGALKVEMSQSIKALEKKTKTINNYIKAIDQSE